MSKKYSENEIFSILKEHESGISMRELGRKYQVHRDTISSWKQKYGGMDPSQMKKLKELQSEHDRLKRMYADLSMEPCLKRSNVKKALKPAERRQWVRELIEGYGLSIRQACSTVSLSRTVYSYQPKEDQEDITILVALDELTDQHSSLGFWKLYHMLRGRGYRWNHKRVYRIYCTMRLNIRRKKKRRVAKREAIPLLQPLYKNESWSIDFMSDALWDGTRFRTLNIIDDYNREALSIEVDNSIGSSRVVRCLKGLVSELGAPGQIRVDNGPEFTSFVFRQWCEQVGIRIQYIQPGKPSQNAFIERFNGSYRNEVLNTYLFNSITEVRNTTRKWLWHYNSSRPHEALMNMTPLAFANRRNSLVA
ncbi:MAG: IS3 family transposase [Bacteroidota bacterium]